MPKTREMTYPESVAALQKADKDLISAAKTGDKDAIRACALEFSRAERDARSAKQRENSFDIAGALSK